MKTGKITAHRLFEPLLLFCLFYLPGFLQQGSITDFSVLNRIGYQLFYFVLVIPQILLTLYLMKCSPVNSVILPVKSEWYGLYGLRKPTVHTLFYSIVLLIVVWIYVFLVSDILLRLKIVPAGENNPWIMNSKPAIILFIITSQLTGWSEELFFRGFLLRRALIGRVSPVPVIIIISLLFGVLHLYQGISGFFVTTGIGLIFSFFYIKTGDLTTTAITHGLYNMSVMIIAYNFGTF